MPWIEGIGDEVTIFFSVVLGLCILLAAWFSTGIRDIPFISVMIVQLRRRRRPQESSQSTTHVAEASPDPDELQTSLTHDGDVETIGQSEDVAEQSVETEQSADNAATLQQPCEEATVIDRGVHESLPNSNEHLNSPNDSVNNIETTSDSSALNEEPENLTPTELRKRRLEFLSGSSDKSCDTTLDTENKSNEISENQASVEEQISATTETKTNSSRLDGQTSPNITTSYSQSASDAPADNSGSNQVLDNEEGAITVKIKFLNDTQRQVEANLNETIGSFRRRHFPTEISESKLVRFIYNGQDLRNDASTLQSYNIGDNSVLHCLITQPRQEEHPAAANMDDNGLDIGVFMFPLFGLLLSIVWYARFTYRQIFNVTSTLTLSGITFLYLAALLSSLRRPRVHEHVD